MANLKHKFFLLILGMEYVIVRSVIAGELYSHGSPKLHVNKGRFTYHCTTNTGRAEG